MNQLNSVILEGNLVRKAEISEPVAGFKTCRFPIAVNRWYKNREGQGVSEVSFIEIETFGRMAEFCEKKCQKGRGIRVVGRLKQNRWKNSEGKAVSRLSVIAEHIDYKPLPAAEAGAAETESEQDDELMPETEPAPDDSDFGEEACEF